MCKLRTRSRTDKNLRMKMEPGTTGPGTSETGTNEQQQQMEEEHVLLEAFQVFPSNSPLRNPRMLGGPRPPTTARTQKASLPAVMVVATERKKTKPVLLTARDVTGCRQPAKEKISPLSSPLKHLISHY